MSARILATMLRLTTLRARWRRLVSATNITISWRRRRTKALSSASASVGSWVSVSRPWLRAECPNCASTSASSRSVLASLPRLRANSRHLARINYCHRNPGCAQLTHQQVPVRHWPLSPPPAALQHPREQLFHAGRVIAEAETLTTRPPRHIPAAPSTSTPTITSPCAIAPPPSRTPSLPRTIRPLAGRATVRVDTPALGARGSVLTSGLSCSANDIGLPRAFPPLHSNPLHLLHTRMTNIARSCPRSFLPLAMLASSG